MTNNPRKATKEEGRLSGLKALLLPAAAVLLAVLLNSFVVMIAIVPSGSMAPTVEKDAVIIALRTPPFSCEFSRGDIIIFENKDVADTLLMKRIIALPGERVKLTCGRVFINGEEYPVEEPYVEVYSEDSFEEVAVPDDCYFVLGDNRCESQDSRFWDDPFVPAENIKSKAKLKLYPNPRSLE